MATIKMSAEEFLNTDFEDPATMKRLGLISDVVKHQETEQNKNSSNSKKSASNKPHKS